MSLNPGAIGGQVDDDATSQVVERLAPAYLETYRGPHGGAPGSEAAVTGPMSRPAAGAVPDPALVEAQYRLGRQRPAGTTRVAVYGPDDPGGFGPALQIVTDNATLLMDSVTRFARALREIGLASGEPPVRRGFPPSVFAELPRLFERAGCDARGAITGIYTVLLEDEEDDPVGEEVRSLLDGHVILSRKLAARGHYPAIDILVSQSRLMGQLMEEGERRAALSFRAMLAKLDEIELLLQVGDYKPGQDALADRAIARRDELNGFLRQSTHEPAPLPMTRTILRGFE